MALLSFRLDLLLLLRLVFGWCGGAVGLGLRARFLSASSSARHGGCSSLLFASSVVRCAALVQLLCRLQAVQLLLCGTRGFKARSSDGALMLEYATHRAMLIDAQRRRIYSRIGPGSPAMAPRPRDFFMLKICLKIHGDTYDRAVSMRELNEFRSLISLKKGG